MTRTDILQSLHRLVLTTPAIDTFIVRQSRPDWESPSFGASYEDFLQGHFISTDWYLAGADPDKITASYPALFVEQVSVSKPSVYGRQVCFTFDLLLLDKYCRDCRHHSREALLADTLDALRLVVSELLTYQTTPDGMRSEGEILHTGGTPSGDVLDSYLNSTALDYQQVTIDPVTMGYSVRLVFCFCDQPIPDWNYDVPQPDLLASDKPCIDC